MPILIALLLASLALAIFGKDRWRLVGIVTTIAVIGLFFLFLGLSPSADPPAGN